MEENKNTPLIPRRIFVRRVSRVGLKGVAVLVAALGVGMVGYHHFEGVSWVDAYVDAAMILSGMGPLGELHTTGGKIFAGTYALFSGVVLLTTIGVFLAPIVHRLFHKFHLANEEIQKKKLEAKK
jgi:hypothetical protein